ncbi:MAG: alpha/beta hydrolase [Burkholderiaceae bacterium]
MDRQLYDPDHQAPMPFAAADDYARQVMAWAQEPLPDDVVMQRAIAYGPHRLHRYDVFAPRGARNAPVLVFWHGGGWTNGYRNYTTWQAAQIVRLGMVLVAPSYRLAPEHPMPCAFEDALALLRTLQDSPPSPAASANRFFLGGHSAGGHIAALTALRVAERARIGLKPDCVRGCLPISGIMDMHAPNPPPGSLEERVYTHALKGRDALLDTVLSPLFWAAGNRLPFALTYGESDSPRVIKSNQRLFAMLQAQPDAAPLSCVVEAGRDHFQTHTALRNPSDGWYTRLSAMVVTDSV